MAGVFCFPWGYGCDKVSSMEGTITHRLRETAPGERPQERLLRLGPGALSDAELLALLLRSGTQGHDVLSVAHTLLRRAERLTTLLTWAPADFRRTKGIGPVKAVQLVTCLELVRRILHEDTSPQPVMDTPHAIAKLLIPCATGQTVEKFWVLCLNRKNRLLKRLEITSGIATSSLAHPREVFREAIREGAVAIACAHNHPSGDPTPSAADIAVTRQLRDAARTIDITLLDHVILGQVHHDPQGKGFYSFRESGLL